MTNTMPRCGLDVHANQTHAATLELATGELRRRRIQGPPERALDYLESLGAGLLAVYEAGPTGFGLARAAEARGIDLRVAAPGLIPRGPSDRVKTDARDAERLARLLAAGELRFVCVPTLAEERFRDLVRCREDLRGDLMRARHRLSKLLLRRGIRYPGPGKNWTRAHRDWLGRLEFSDEPSRVTFADYLASVEALGQRRSTLDAAIERCWSQSPHAQTIARLRAFRGIDTLTAARPARRPPRDHAVGAHLRREATPGSDHQGGVDSCAPPIGGGRPPLRQAPRRRHRACPPPGGP